MSLGAFVVSIDMREAQFRSVCPSLRTIFRLTEVKAVAVATPLRQMTNAALRLDIVHTRWLGNLPTHRTRLPTQGTP